MKTKPIYKTESKTLRFIADSVFEPISMYFFDKSLRIYFRDEDGIELMTPKLRLKMKIYSRIYNILNIPCDKWGTTYLIIGTNLWEKESNYEYKLDEIW